MLDVLIVSPKELLFEGKAQSAVFPGELGVFEVLSFHKPLLSRLINGIIRVDEFSLAVSRGVVSVHSNKITVVVET